jgi:hypothetical protein
MKNTAAATMFSSISFCGEDAFLLRLHLLEANQPKSKSKSSEKRSEEVFHSCKPR